MVSHALPIRLANAACVLPVLTTTTAVPVPPTLPAMRAHLAHRRAFSLQLRFSGFGATQCP
jgi:hypothetical protein